MAAGRSIARAMFADLSEVLRAYVVDKAPADEGGAC
jgi:hypothetical protein